MYTIDGALFISELDNYEMGCIETAANMHVELHIKESTLPNLIDELKRQFNIKNNEEMSFNSCDELGRIDISFTSLKPHSFERASAGSFEKFKRNEVKLYINTYSVYVEKIEAVDLSLLNFN
jgi:hypothetical protein